jgi:hypothetical protein
VRQYTLFCRERAGTTDFRLTKNVSLEMWRNASFGMVENQQVAKIVQCGETLAEKNRTDLVSTEYSGTGRSIERLMRYAFLLCFSLTACNRLCRVLPDSHCIKKLT